MAAPTFSAPRSLAARTLAARTRLTAVWDNRGMTARSKLLSFVFLCVAAAAGVAAALIWFPKPPVVLASGTVLVPSRALADFSLIDNQGRRFGSANLRRHCVMRCFRFSN